MDIICIMSHESDAEVKVTQKYLQSSSGNSDYEQ